MANWAMNLPGHVDVLGAMLEDICLCIHKVLLHHCENPVNFNLNSFKSIFKVVLPEGVPNRWLNRCPLAYALSGNPAYRSRHGVWPISFNI